MHDVGYVKQYDNIFRNGSSTTNAAFLQQTSSKVSSLISNSARNAASQQNSVLPSSIISPTNKGSLLAATFSVASTIQSKDRVSDNDPLTRQESPKNNNLKQIQVMLIYYIQSSGKKKGNDEKDFASHVKYKAPEKIH